MNGDTKLKLRGGLVGAFIGAFVVLFITLVGAVYGYGQLNNKVDTIEGRMFAIQDMRDRLVRVENNVEWIKNRLGE